MTVLTAHTAFSVSLQRAAHVRQDPAPHILEDEVAWSLLTTDERALITERPQLFANRPARAFRQRLLVRQRYAEDALREAVAEGATQYVILGAGMDSFALRQPAWAKGLSIFEVDRPDEQARKQSRIRTAGLPTPTNLRFVPADFEQDDVATRLRQAGFRDDVATFFACLGVLVYLTRPAIEGLLRLPLALDAPAQFAASTTGRIEGGSEGVLARLAGATNERWITPLGLDEMSTWLTQLGFSQVHATDTDLYAQTLEAPPLGPVGGGAPSYLFRAVA